MVTLIIPYYQREPGILRRALLSVVAQRDCKMPLKIIVVDDGSPASAKDEIESLGDVRLDIRCVSQKNGGPGAARNTGLEQVEKSTKYVAFLDSDDEWVENHLANAVCALEAGYGVYFTDQMQLGSDVSAFKRAGRICLEDHPNIGSSESLHAFRGDMFNQIIFGNLIGTSGVVYDFSCFGNQRFKTELTNAGEDYLFWIDLALAGAKFSFSENIGFVCGRGVNIYAGSGWGTDNHMLRLHNEIKFKKSLLENYTLNKKQQVKIKADVQSLRASFARDILHRIRNGKKVSFGLLASHLKIDPLSFLMLPYIFFRH